MLKFNVEKSEFQSSQHGMFPAESFCDLNIKSALKS